MNPGILQEILIVLGIVALTVGAIVMIWGEPWKHAAPVDVNAGTVIARDTVIVHDTIPAYVPPISIRKARPTRIDTVRIDTASAEVAALHTVIETATPYGIRHDTIEAQYIGAPWRQFSIALALDSIRVPVSVPNVTTVREVEVERVSWPWVLGGVAAGVIGGVLVHGK
jgi:hypothetical protein